MITIEKIDTLNSLPEISSAWKSLLQKSDIDTIYQTPEWLGTWWKYFGDGRKLYILTAKSGEELVGIAPLMLTGGKIEFIGVPNADYSDIIGKYKPELLKHFLKYLDEHRSDWSRISLSQIPERSSSLPYLRSMHNPKMIIKEIETCLGYVYEGSETERPNFSFPRSKTVRTSMNVLQKNGGLFYDRLMDPSSWRKYLPLLFQMHIQRWDGTPTPSKFLQEKHRRFYFELPDTLGENGVCIFRIRNRNIPVALSFNFDYNCALTFYTLAVNRYYARRSPGQILMALQGETFVRQGYILDYSRGAHDYKNAFANRTSKNYEVTIYPGRASHISARAIDQFKVTRPVAALLQNRKFENLKLILTEEYKRNGPKGLFHLWIETAGRILKRYVINYSAHIIFRFDGIPPKPIKPADLPVRIKKLAQGDIPQIATFYGAAENTPQYGAIVEGLRKNNDCFAVIIEGNIAALSLGIHQPDKFDPSRRLIMILRLSRIFWLIRLMIATKEALKS
jgi:CelD/BcsL family acetyltransferase involved in cellulose biosynthesis